MIISYAASGEVTVKAKTETATLGSEIRLGSFVINGPGEYDVADTHCDARMAGEALACFIRSEELTVTYMTTLDTEITKLDDASATNILVVDVKSDDTPDKLKSILKAIEPSYLVLAGAGATKEYAASVGQPLVEGSSLKLTKAGLPLEGTQTLIPD